MTNQEQIQVAVDAAIAAVPFQWRNRDTKTTKKALREIEELGLTEYLPANMREHGGKYASSVAAVIKAATFAGSSKIASSMNEDGDSWTETQEAHELHNLLNVETAEETTYTVENTSDTNYVEEVPALTDEATQTDVDSYIGMADETVSNEDGSTTIKFLFDDGTEPETYLISKNS